MLDFNGEVIEKVLKLFIKDTVHKNRFKKTILGVSGGIDSAVILALAVKALGAENVHGLLMPYKLSSESSLKDGKTVCEQFGVKYDVIDISPSVDAYFDRYPATDKMQIGNKCARERMSVLYDFSARQHALVAGTCNKSEILIGYSTIWGDSASAYLPIGDLYKTQVFALAKHLNIPKEIIEKKPSADLWENQTDEGEIGLTYKELDEILCQMVDCRISKTELLEKGYKQEKLDRITNLIINSQYKRTMPAIAKLQARTVGPDFRYPRDWNK